MNTCGQQHQQLKGRLGNGEWATTRHKEYPYGLCLALAQSFHLHCVRKQIHGNLDWQEVPRSVAQLHVPLDPYAINTNVAPDYRKKPCTAETNQPSEFLSATVTATGTQLTAQQRAIIENNRTQAIQRQQQKWLQWSANITMRLEATTKRQNRRAQEADIALARILVEPTRLPIVQHMPIKTGSLRRARFRIPKTS